MTAGPEASEREILKELADFAWPQARQVADLWVRSWEKTMPEIDFEARRPWFVHHLSDLVDQGHLVKLAVMQSGEISGFVTLDPATGYLDQIAVAPHWWGTGVAGALLAEARRLGPGVVTLDVNRANDRAVAFYRRNGFEVIGEGVNPRSGLPTLKLQWRSDEATDAAEGARGE